MPSKRPPVQFRLPEDEDQALLREAADRLLTVNAMAQRIVQDHLHGRVQPAQPVQGVDTEAPHAGSGVWVPMSEEDLEELQKAANGMRCSLEEAAERLMNELVNLGTQEALEIFRPARKEGEITRHAIVPGDEGGRTFDELGLYPDTLPKGRKDARGIMVGWP